MPNNLEGAQKGDTHDARTFSSSPHMPPAVYQIGVGGMNKAGKEAGTSGANGESSIQ